MALKLSRRAPLLGAAGGLLLLIVSAESAAAGALEAPSQAILETNPAGQRAFASGDLFHTYAIWAGLAKRGDPAAALNLAAMLDQGTGIPRDPVAASRWYRVAAELGSPEAQLDVGVMFDSGRGVERDVAKAAVRYGRAAAHGQRRAQYNLGQLYDTGKGVPRNREAART